MNPFISTLVYEREIEAADNRACLIELRAPALTAQWWDEYMATGRIDWLDWDGEDLAYVALHTGESDFKEIIEREAVKAIEAALDADKYQPWMKQILGLYDIEPVSNPELQNHIDMLEAIGQ